MRIKFNKYLIPLILSFNSALILAQDICYNPTRKAGVEAYNTGDKKKAKLLFEQAQKCPDKPKENDLSDWIKKCNTTTTANQSTGSSLFKINTAKYDFVDRKYKGLPIRVFMNQKSGWVNDNGEEIIPCIYESIYGGHGVEKSRYQAVKYNGKWGIIDILSNIIIVPFEYDNGSLIQNGIMRIGQNNKYGYVDINNIIIIPIIYQELDIYFSGSNTTNTLWAKKENKWGVIDLNNNIIVSFIYDKVDYCQRCEGNGRYVWKDGKKGIVSHTGEIIEPIIHDEYWE